MQKNKKSLPFVSVIMPIRNEANFIEKSLGAVLAQNYPHDCLEIVIADGISTDETLSLIKKLSNNTDIPIIIVDNPEKIAPTALNRAIAKAKGEIIVRVDGHTIIDKDYVSECVFALSNTDACNVGGKMNAVSQNLVGNAVSLVTSSKFGIGNGRFHYSNKQEYVDTVYLGAWNKKIFKKYGLFNEELVRNQDDEFNYRLRANGCKILLSPKIKSYYFNRSSLKSLWRQYFQYGYWKVRVLQLHPKQMSLRQFIPFAFVITLIFLSIFIFFSSIGLLALGFVLGLYCLANLFATLLTASEIKITALPYVSLGFAILHFSYGLGFLCGLIAFRNEWRGNRRVKTVNSAF